MLDTASKKYVDLVEGDIIIVSTGDGNKFYAVDVPVIVMGVDTDEIWVTEVTYDDAGTWSPAGESEPIPMIRSYFHILALK